MRKVNRSSEASQTHTSNDAPDTFPAEPPSGVRRVSTPPQRDSEVISIRDRFAIAFITGAHATAEAWLDADALATRAYAVADALLLARKANRDADDADDESGGLQ